MNITKVRVFGLMTALCAGVFPAVATSQEVSFQGKRIQMVISSGEGGGADAYARLLGTALENELPGSPTIIPRNMAGGGGLIASNWFEANARPDGLILYSAAASSKTLPIFGDGRNINFDSSGWVPVVTSPAGYVMSGTKIAGTMSMEEILSSGKALNNGIASTTGVGLGGLLAWDMLGVKVNAAVNVPGGEARLSLERGEFHVNASPTATFFTQVQPLVETGEMAPLWTWGFRNADGEIVRDPLLPDVPTFREVYVEIHGEEPSGMAWQVWQAMFDIGSMNSKTIVLPKGTPDDITQTYRDAAERALTDPEFVASPVYQIQFGATPHIFGEQAKIEWDRATAGFTPEAVEWIRQWALETHNLVI